MCFDIILFPLRVRFNFLDSDNFTIQQIADIERGGADADLETRLVYSGERTAVDVFDRRWMDMLIYNSYCFPLLKIVGPPPDGKPNEEIVGILIAVTTVFTILAITGIILAVIGMSLQLAYKKKK